MEGWLGRLSVEAARLAGEFEMREDARPLEEVDSPGRTKVSVLGEEDEAEGPMRWGTAMGPAAPLPIAAMTFSMTCCWSSWRHFFLAASQMFSLSILEASTSSSWQHTGMALAAREAMGCSSGGLGWGSWACFSLCFRTRTSTIPWSVSNISTTSEGSGSLLAKKAL